MCACQRSALMDESLALSSKSAGLDIFHIGDAGYSGMMALSENIQTLSITVRGKRHTYIRMAASSALKMIRENGSIPGELLHSCNRGTYLSIIL